MLSQISFSLPEISAAAKQFWSVAKSYRHIAFSGELGAGKTTFIHALCDYLQVKDAVSSPTFALINEYHFVQDEQETVIYHMDWYRLRDADEAVNAGMEDCMLQAKAYCFIEWPERADELLRSPYLWVAIEAVDDYHRVMNVEVR